MVSTLLLSRDAAAAKNGLEGLCAPALAPASTLGPNRRLRDAGRPYPRVSQRGE